MDPLSDVLALLKPQSHVSAGFDAGGIWAVAFSGNVGIKCYAVVSGGCWLTVEGVGEPVRLATGDSILLPGGRPFRLGNDPATPVVDSTTVFPASRPGGVVTLNGGGDLFLVGSRFTLRGEHAGLLLAMLPPIVHIAQQTEQAALRWAVERMMRELQAPQPGGDLVAQHLAHLMLLQALRLHIATAGSDRVGWLFALADPYIGAAIGALHADPARPWTLATLASHVGLSRSALALRFKRAVGTPPMEYLTRWRLLLAADRLTSTNDAIAAIAASLGYESESAFGTAFKRVMGRAPRQYARGRDAVSA